MKFFMLTYFLLCLTGPLAFANNSFFLGKEIKIVYAENWAPISYGEQNTVKGILPEIIDHILAKNLGMNVTHIPVPWARAQKMVESGQADAFITTATAARLKYSEASKHTLYTLPFVGATKTGSQTEKLFSDPDDLSHLYEKRFCDVLGNGWATAFYQDKPVKLHIVPTIRECLLLLNAGRVDVIIHAGPVLRKYISELNLEDKISIMKKPSLKSPAFPLLVSKKSNLPKGFLKKFDTFIDENLSLLRN